MLALTILDTMGVSLLLLPTLLAVYMLDTCKVSTVQYSSVQCSTMKGITMQLSCSNKLIITSLSMSQKAHMQAIFDNV